MNKLFVFLFCVFEFFFYTLFMVLVESLTINNVVLKSVVHFLSLIIISGLLYVIMKFIIKKLKLNVKKMLYLISIWNLVLGLVAPVLVLVIIPSETLATLAVVLMISTVYYGLFINITLCILNLFGTK